VFLVILVPVRQPFCWVSSIAVTQDKPSLLLLLLRCSCCFEDTAQCVQCMCISISAVLLVIVNKT
jgi:hypothetical protein